MFTQVVIICLWKHIWYWVCLLLWFTYLAPINCVSLFVSLLSYWELKVVVLVSKVVVFLSSFVCDVLPRDLISCTYDWGDLCLVCLGILPLTRRPYPPTGKPQPLIHLFPFVLQPCVTVLNCILNYWPVLNKIVYFWYIETTSPAPLVFEPMCPLYNWKSVSISSGETPKVALSELWMV